MSILDPKYERLDYNQKVSQKAETMLINEYFNPLIYFFWIAAGSFMIITATIFVLIVRPISHQTYLLFQNLGSINHEKAKGVLRSSVYYTRQNNDRYFQVDNWDKNSSEKTLTIQTAKFDYNKELYKKGDTTCFDYYSNKDKKIATNLIHC